MLLSYITHFVTEIKRANTKHNLHYKQH